MPSSTCPTGDTAQDHDLRISHIGYDRTHTTATDSGTWFPLPALRRAVASGRIGALAKRFHGAPTNRSHRVTIDTDAPEILRRCQEDGADAAILVPNCPVCHQTASLTARHLEANGLPTVVMGAATHRTRLVVARAGEPAAVGTAADRADLGLVAEQREQLGPTAGIPYAHRAVPARGGEPAGVGTEADRVDRPGMALESELVGAAAGVPQPHGLVLGSGGEPAGVGTVADRVDRAAWPLSVPRSAPLCTSHSLSVSSSPALAMRLASGL